MDEKRLLKLKFTCSILSEMISEELGSKNSDPDQSISSVMDNLFSQLVEFSQAPTL